MSRRPPSLGSRLCAGVLCALALASGCGARTDPLPGQEPCGEAGQTRSCANACGPGEQRCEDGFWSDCDVPPAERACSNACGAGLERCEDGAWSACQVAPVMRGCSDPCGNGFETCRDGAWGACEVERLALPCSSVCGAGEEICERGRWRACNAPQPKPPKLAAVIRDFSDAHPDFEIPERGNRFEAGLVLGELGPDDKPVYAGRPDSTTTSGRANFDQWYNTIAGVNVETPIDLQLQPSPDSPGLFVYADTDFFPIDDRLLGNEGRSHNYHFTLEAKTTFQYVGGEVFRFSGDDDMWVFINRRLAIDLGGIHNTMSATVELDAARDQLGLAIGRTYSLHFFFAERHTIASNFTIETSIAEPGSCE